MITRIRSIPTITFQLNSLFFSGVTSSGLAIPTRLRQIFLMQSIGPVLIALFSTSLQFATPFSWVGLSRRS
jgi:hypothetical protein